MGLRLMGNKIGMTQIFDEDGSVVPVTVLKVGPCVVVDKKTAPRNGYCALVLGYGDAKKESRLRMSEIGLYKKAGIEPKTHLLETRVSAEELDNYEIGQQIDLSIFSKGDHVDVTYSGWLSSGQGFGSGSFDFVLGTSQAIQGFDEGVTGMKPGGKRKLVIPPELAYGNRGQGSIPPNATLVFEVQLVRVR